jgi:uncharacterized membrane protein
MDCVIVYVAFLHVFFFFFLYLVPIFVIFLTPRGQAVMTCCYLGLLKGCRIKE